MAHIAMKDLPWKKCLAGPEKGHVIEAHEKELDVLLTTKLKDTLRVKRAVLEEPSEDHPEFACASGTNLMGVHRQPLAGKFWNTSNPESGRQGSLSKGST